MKNKNKSVGIVGKYMFLAFTGFWLFMSYNLVFRYDFGLSVVSYVHRNDCIQSEFQKYDENSRVFKCTFRSRDNYLGIISVKVAVSGSDLYQKDNKIRFRLMEGSDGATLYSNDYSESALQEYMYFPFGFPVIDSSAGRLYTFEITETNPGSSGFGLTIPEEQNMIITRYQYPRHDIFSSAGNFIVYIIRKLGFIMSADVYLGLFVFSLPVDIYILWEFVQKFRQILSRTKTLENALIYSIPVMVLYEVIFIRQPIDGIFGFILLFWVYLNIRLSSGPGVSFHAGILLLISSSVLLPFDRGYFSNKLSIWSFIFFASGSILLVYNRLMVKLLKVRQKRTKS